MCWTRTVNSSSRVTIWTAHARTRRAPRSGHFVRWAAAGTSPRTPAWQRIVLHRRFRSGEMPGPLPCLLREPGGCLVRRRLGDDMDRFQSMQVFARVVELNSFSRAADALRLPRSTVSVVVRKLEAHLRARLM